MDVINDARRYRLASGLEINIEHVPHLQRAAVVWIVPVGSHQEPKEWPGLAHLTEHMVFAGGQQFRDQQRLMPWIQKRGGRINATTQQNYTAYYFDIEPDELQQGVLRLNDMLTAPRFTLADLQRETRVIDEEYQLYSRSPHALASAAIHSKIEYPRAFSDFHIGNARTFGNDMTKLAEALKHFYAESYAPECSQVWIAAPLSCQQQYAKISECLAMTEASEILQPPPSSWVADGEPITWQNWQGEICLTRQPGLGISLVVVTCSLSDWPILVELISDTAPGSLSQTISQQLGHFISVRVERHYHDNQQIFFTLWFEGADFSEKDAQQSLRIWQQWWEEASRLSAEHINHYEALAQAEALRLPAMEFLREHALGFIFASSAETDLRANRLQQAFSSITCYALLRSRHDVSIQNVECQGLHCRFRTTQLEPGERAGKVYAFTFYPQPRARPTIIPALTENPPRVPLHYCHEPSGRVKIVLRPAAGAAITDTVRESLIQALSPVFSLAKHAAGEVIWQQVRGNDLLCISFKHVTELKECVANLIRYWPKTLPPSTIDRYASLSLRELLQNMPSLLADDLDQWMVSYIGHAQDEAEALETMLSALPLSWQTFTADRLPLQRTLHYTANAPGSATLLAFIPYPLISSYSNTVYHRLAGYYESAFYHQLREVEAVGYAVACRQRVYRDRWGLQIILQSSHLSVSQLCERVVVFFEELNVSDKALAAPLILGDQGSGDEEIDRYLEAHLPLPSVSKQKDEMDNLSPEKAHAALIRQIKDKTGGWVFIE